MRTQIKLHLKRLISLGIAFALLLSTIGISGTIAYAAEDDFDEVTLALSSNVVNDDTIDLYLLDEVHYISIDDLCRLTRSTKSVDGDVISVTQGMWRAEFDTASQTFNDGYQMVDITVLQISKDDYAVPALMFLSYYKAMAMIRNDVLYCDLPAYTAWEALDLDYSSSLVDIYELYGGEGNVELSLTLDILMDFIMGKNPTTEKYLKSAYYEALDVDIYSNDAVEQYVNERNEVVYNDLVAEETQSLLESLSNICGSGDTTNKITQEAMDLYILFHCTGQTRDFYNLAYNAMEIGDTTSVRRYADQIASVWREGEFQKSLVKNNAKSVEGAFFLLSSAVEAAQQVKYTHQENNLVYRVMGQENMKKLSLDVGANEWYTVANVYKSTATSLQNSFVNILEDLQTVAINDLVSEAAGKIGVDTFLESAASKATGIKGIKAASWKIGLEVGRGAVQLFSWIDSLAESDSLVDILFVDVGAYEADRLALYLSELQQNVYWVLCNERERMYNNLGDATAYQDYIYAQQLYCRTSIAMYENLIAMNDEFGSDKDYWRSLFQERIDMLAVALYQLTTIQDDGVNACLPLDLETFICVPLSSQDVSIIFEEFVYSGAYRQYISSDYAVDELEYTIYDLNNDGIPELLIQSTNNRPWFSTWLFALHGKSVVLISEDSGYGQYRYLASKNLIIGSPEWKPFGGTGYSPFYCWDGKNFSFAFEIVQDMEIWYYCDEESKVEISDDERATYFSDIVWFDWLPIESLLPSQSVQNIKTSTKTDLGQYLNTNIFDFIEMIGDMYDVGATDGSKEYSNGTIVVSAGYDSDQIQYISINGECNFSIKGIEYGMSFSNAAEIATENCSYISRDLPYYKYFMLKDGTNLSIHAEDEVTLDAINLFSNQ